MDDSAKGEEFAAALTAAQDDPGNDERWDELEQLADELQRPDEVSTTYREALDRGLAKDLAPRVAERAVEFCQAWYIDTPEAMPELLGAIVERYPDLDWAFERLVVLLTSSGNWADLLALYDRGLAATRDEGKRRQLLDDAARLAKDFADQPDRAADYLQQLLVLDPGNDKVVTSLERLLERGGRHIELLTLWRERIPKLPPEEARATRARIAEVCIEQLGEPERAMAELRDLVEESPGHPEACTHLERILELDTAPLEARREALAALRKTYQIVQRREDVVRVLEMALTFVEPEDRPALRRECGNRLAILERDEEAIAHFAQLLKESAEDVDARRQIRQLARRSDRRDLYAKALLDAAEATEDKAQQAAMWLEAAVVTHDALEDAPGAIELYRRVLDTEDAEHAHALSAAHQLDELLAASNQLPERLTVLERLAVLERSPAFRRQLVGEAARLAEQLEDLERSLTLWREALDRDPEDLEALGAVIDLLERTERWDELVSSLAQRAAAPVSPQQQRADMVRGAKTQQDKLELLDASIDSWLAIRERFGEDHECLAALDGLMSETERWQDLSNLLDGAVNRERDETARRIDRLADIYRSQLAQLDFSLPLYVQAIELDPGDGAAREGLSALLEEPACGKRAAEALARAFERTEDWLSLIELLEPRLGLTESDESKAELLHEAAGLHEKHGDDVAAAMAAMVRAVPLDPRRRELRRQLLRLAEATEAWTDATEALAAAAAALTDDPDSAAELRILEAQLHEDHLDDWASAFEARQAAGELVPGDAKTLLAVAKSAAKAGRWPAAGQATVSAVITLGRLEPTLITELEQAAEALEVWSDLADALAEAVSAASAELDPELASKLWGHVGDWYRDRCEDHEGATQATKKALELTPENVDVLKRLVALQRNDPGPDFADTLMMVDKLGDERSLDALHEAAELALGGEDPEQARRVLGRLYRKATDLWLTDQEASGEHGARETCLWALDQLVAGRVDANDADQAARLLMGGAELPVDPGQAAEFSLRAAELLAKQGNRLRAIDAYRRALAATPEALETIRELAELSEAEEQRSGSVALRERELALTSDGDERLALRLANSQRAAVLEARSGRVASLLANLDDAPGHPASLDALYAILDERGRHEELSEVLEQQADKLAELGDAERAATLWGQKASISERNLRAPERAIGAHERVVELAQTNASLDALARLHLEAEAPAEAIPWLQRRLDSSAPKERVAVLLKLARTQLKAERAADAIATLQTAFAEAPQNAEVRKLLIKQLRKRESWQPLASTLAVAVEHATDNDTVLAYAREAAELFYDKLETPEQAVPVLRKAVELAPEDRKLRSMLGEGLRVVGELDEAKELLTKLIEDYGRRGSKDRAAVHLLLGKVLHAQEQHDEAIGQLDIASKMDADNVVVLRTLAELSREAGELERAERALRTLLLTTRRLQADAATATEIGTSEVMFELSSLASARGQQEQAEELAESAIESLAEGDAHAPRLQAKLRDRGEYDLLVRLLDARLTYTQSPYRRGLILGEKATILAEQLERPADALATRLKAIENDPGSPMLHDGAWRLAASVDQLDHYVEHCETLLSKARRDTDAMVRCELLLRLGEVAEAHEEDFERAGQLYEQAKETGVRDADVLRAQARAAGARGDEEEQLRVLNHLASLGEDQAETRASAQYRMAEVQLANVDSLDTGLEALRKALDDSPNFERAAAILRRTTEQHEHNDLLLDAYEQVARDSGDDRVMLHYLEQRARHPEATTDQVREAVAKATVLEEGDRAETLMQRAVELGRETADGLFAVDWALLGLAERCKDKGDAEGAIRWLDEAGDVADPERLFTLSREVADLAVDGTADPALAAKLYERLRERDPTARGAWEPLVGIYRQQGDVESLERVVRETLDSLADVNDRNALRVELAKTLLAADGRTEDAVSVLRDALIDDPGHVDALTTLSDYFENSDQQDELVELLAEQLSTARDRGDAAAIKAASLRLGGLVEPDEAIPIYRQALEAGDDADLLATLLDAIGPEGDTAERASLTERLLAVQEGPEAVQL
ncbi:MAG: hypothetical protein JRI68_08430, partial [Deltaproteobacteria bacterium]|nr:hypothetical protein [Deltaproteobacteria bacterium]